MGGGDDGGEGGGGGGGGDGSGGGRCLATEAAYRQSSSSSSLFLLPSTNSFTLRSSLSLSLFLFRLPLLTRLCLVLPLSRFSTSPLSFPRPSPTRLFPHSLFSILDVIPLPDFLSVSLSLRLSLFLFQSVFFFLFPPHSRAFMLSSLSPSHSFRSRRCNFFPPRLHTHPTTLLGP